MTTVVEEAPLTPAMSQLLQWTAQHHTVITEPVMRSIGLSVDQRKHLVRIGMLERIVDGSYRFTGGPADELARCVAVCARPGRLVIAGPTAGRILGLRRMPRDTLIHVIAPPHSNPSVEPWLIPYRTAMIDDTDVIHRPDGIRITSAERTAVDLVRHLPPADVRSVIDQLIHEGRCTVASLHATAEPLVTPGRPWARRFIQELAKRPDGGAPESHWESRVVAALVHRGVHGLETQHWLDVPDWGRIRFDAAVPHLRWGIEVDGFPDHFTEAGSSMDDGRDLACDAIGWCVSRVTGQTLRRSFDAAIDALMRVHDHLLHVPRSPSTPAR
jgi:hypothetical protein